MYRYTSGVTEYNTYSLLSVELDGSKNFYSYLLDSPETYDVGVNMLYDPNNAIVFAFFHGTEERIYTHDVTSANDNYGAIRSTIIFDDCDCAGSANNNNVPVYSSVDDILLVPYVN